MLTLKGLMVSGYKLFLGIYICETSEKLLNLLSLNLYFSRFILAYFFKLQDILSSNDKNMLLGEFPLIGEELSLEWSSLTFEIFIFKLFKPLEFLISCKELDPVLNFLNSLCFRNYFPLLFLLMVLLFFIIVDWIFPIEES